MDEKNIRSLSLEDLEGVAGGATEAEWDEWAKAWKNWWIDHYGNVVCYNCHRRLRDVIASYDTEMAYNTYMNNAFLCKCGRVITATESWK